MAIYFTSDLHMGDNRPHKKKAKSDLLDKDEDGKLIAKWEDKIIENWNNTVSEEDIVYVLGDLSKDFGSITFLKELNGEKILIKGNHDFLSDKNYLKYFSSIHKKLVLEDIFSVPVNLVHKPSDTITGMFNFVGHIHDTWKRKKDIINVGVDVWNLFPVSQNRLQELIDGQEYLDEEDFFKELLEDEIELKNKITTFGSNSAEFDKLIQDMVVKLKEVDKTMNNVKDGKLSKFNIYLIDYSCQVEDLFNILEHSLNSNKEIYVVTTINKKSNAYKRFKMFLNKLNRINNNIHLIEEPNLNKSFEVISSKIEKLLNKEK